jgi:hypothetical protein
MQSRAARRICGGNGAVAKWRHHMEAVMNTQTAQDRQENAMLAIDEFDAPGASWDELDQLSALDSLRSEWADGRRDGF